MTWIGAHDQLEQHLQFFYPIIQLIMSSLRSTVSAQVSCWSKLLHELDDGSTQSRTRVQSEQLICSLLHVIIQCLLSARVLEQ